MSCIRGYKIQFTSIPFQEDIHKIRVNKNNSIQLKEAIESLLNIGAISRCKPCVGQFLSSYFLVQKSNGGRRFVLNLKNLNKFIELSHFKLEDIRTVTNPLSRGAYTATIDLRDPYFLIPVHADSRKYLRFLWNELFF